MLNNPLNLDCQMRISSPTTREFPSYSSFRESVRFRIDLIALWNERR
jgi:hypothetical protein